MKKLLATMLFLLPVAAFAAGGGAILPSDPANVDLNNKASLQNGAKMYVNYCLGCHSMEYVRYSRIAQDLGLDEEQTMKSLVLADQKFGNTMDKSMNPVLAKKWFGVDPLDLSLVARVRGEDWLYNYLRSFYKDASRPFGVNNTVFPDVGMPHILADLQGLQAKSEEFVAAENVIAESKPIISDENSTADARDKAEHAMHEAEAVIAQLSHDGKLFVTVQEGEMTPEEYDHNIRDLVAFMAYTANPVKMQSRSIGIWAILFLVILAVFAYFLKKEFWKDIH